MTKQLEQLNQGNGWRLFAPEQSRMPIRAWLFRKRYLLAALLLLMVGFFCLPVVEFEDPTNTVLEDADGTLLSARITSDGQWRFPASDSLPHKVATCIRYFEDEYFYRHPGLNPVSLFKALFRNISAGRVVSGGSTLSMQVVRLSRKGRKRTLGQKIIEIVLALRMELALSKEEIFLLYASHAPFGGNVVGLDAAAWRYYGRAASTLSWGESATLAVLPNAPALIYPGKGRQALLNKRNRLLQKLVEKGELDQLSANLAMSEALPGKPLPLPDLLPHLLERCESEGHGGERLSTTIDLHLQEQLNALIHRHHLQLRQNEIQNAAILVLDVRSATVLAYVGNTRDESEGSGRHVDIIDAPRSSGSILKPLLYTMMLDEGKLLPRMLVPDVPTYMSGYSPLNFDRSYSGAVAANTALVRSLNIPAVRMLRDFGLEKFHARLQELQFSTINQRPGHYGLTLILGGAEVRLWDICRVYAGMARTLNKIEELDYRYDPMAYDAPDYIRKATDPMIPKEPETKTQGIMSAAAIWQCMETLTELERPSVEGQWERFRSSRRIAWKTGTSFGFRDAWAVGVSPEYVVGVWVGNADGEGRPGLTGLQAAAPLMFDAFALLPPTSWFQTPLDELYEISICTKSGFQAGPDCPERTKTLATEKGLRAASCPFHRKIHLDRSGACRVHSNCYPVHDIRTEAWFVLPPLMEWYFKKQNPGYRSLPPYLSGCEPGQEGAMEMIYPPQGHQLFIPRQLDGTLSRIVLEVAHRKPATSIYWHLDDHYLGKTKQIHQMECLAEEGWHNLVLVDARGEVLEKHFEIVGR